MRLSEEDIDLFYKLNWSLLFYVNKKYNIISGLNSPSLKGQPMENVHELHEKLYEHPEMIESFVSENPFGFNDEELAIIKCWKNFMKDKFYIVTHLKEGSIFLNEQRAYLVLSLYDEFEDIFPHLPFMVKTTLLPFKGRIIYNGVFQTYNIFFGSGIRRSVHADYQKAKSRFGVISSLEQPVSERKESEEDLLKFYAKNEQNRFEYADEIDKITKKNPSFTKTYFQEVGKSNARKINKHLSSLGVKECWLAILEDAVVASGQSESEVRQQIEAVLPESRKEYAYIFRHSEAKRSAGKAKEGK